MPRPQRFAQLPLEISNTNMKALALKGEPMIVARINDVGNLGRYRQSGRSNRQFLFEYSKNDGCHVIRIPHSIWHMDKNALANELLDQGNRHQIIITVELAPEQVAALKKALPIEKPKGEPPLRLPRHLRRLPQYVGKPVTKDKHGNLCVDGKPVSESPIEWLPQDQSAVVDEVLSASKPPKPPKKKAAKKAAKKK